jgi:predicted transcriptional regulator
LENFFRELDSYSIPLRKRYGTSRFFNMHRKYRSDFEIFALILEAVKGESAGRYALMKQTGANYAQLDKYLKTLIDVGFIKPDMKEGQVSFRASERGLAFLGQYCVLLGMLLNAYAENEARDGVYEGQFETPFTQQKAVSHGVRK